MSLDKQKKAKVVEKFKTHKTDTGSSEVQIALLTERINEVTDHLKKHNKDFNSRRSLLKMVGRRRRLLNYLKQKDETTFKTIVKDLKIRK